MPECGHEWTTGTGPDDPNDIGHHRCIRNAGHEPSYHGCFCGMTQSVAEDYVDDEWYADD